VVAAAVVLLVVPSTGMAQAALPVGEAHGVRVVRQKGAIVVVFTERAAKRYQRIAGRLVTVECTEQTHYPRGNTEESSGSVTLRAPKRRRKLETGDATRGIDYCRVWLPARTVRRGDGRTRIPRRVIVSVPLTQSGAVFLDEESKARGLFRWLFGAEAVAENLKLSGWPSYAQVVEKLGPEAGQRLVSLASPTDTPPARTIGYYSDGREHVAVATLSRSGRRLFIEAAAGDVLSTNVARYIFGG
jgi:hypothetical protein